MTISSNYAKSVIWDWDNASDFFKEVCTAANQTTNVYDLFNTEWGYYLKSGLDSKDEIDGVGTKTEIYAAAFETLYQSFEREEISKEVVMENATDIWERMYADLAAMNLDDLRNGEMWVTLTNIIEINHVWNTDDKKEIFVTSMAQAMDRTIKWLQVMITAWETAIVNNGRINRLVVDAGSTMVENIKWVLDWMPEWTHKEQILALLEWYITEIPVALWEIEFRGMWGTAKGIMMPEKNKFVDLKPGQYIAAIQEIPKDGIIWPRSNGISAIRGYMTEIAWSDWETMMFEDFLEVIWEEKASMLSDHTKETCFGKQMWDIATGKTTVFNPFVSRKLLGWVDWDPIVNMSSIIHVTWNPWKKIADALPGVWVDLDISGMQVPQIIEILQVAADLSDEVAMNECGWNMWVPKANVYETEEDMKKAIAEWKENGYEIIPIWRTTDESEWRTIRWVWIGNSIMDIPMAA